VIEDYKSPVNGIAWIESSGINYLVAGCWDGMVGMWQVKSNEVSLRWMVATAELDVKDATIQDVQGLSQIDKQLLTQRGAVGEPESRLRETSKKVATMASVVSKLKTPSDRVAEDPEPVTDVMVEQLQQRVEQVKDPLLRNILSGFIRDINGFI
jgi:hypothetical protein